jgi:hypothetical protein
MKLEMGTEFYSLQMLCEMYVSRAFLSVLADENNA